MNIEKIADLIRKRKYRLTVHAQKRMDQRGITLDELKEIFMNGAIVEEYPDDKPYPSCLIMGRIRGGFPLYAVVGVEKIIHVITVHWLDPSKWLDPKTRRERK
jgi:hypothetical protein